MDSRMAVIGRREAEAGLWRGLSGGRGPGDVLARPRTNNNNNNNNNNEDDPHDTCGSQLASIYNSGSGSRSRSWIRRFVDCKLALRPTARNSTPNTRPLPEHEYTSCDSR